MNLCAQPLPTKTAAAQAVVRLAMDKATATRIAASAAGIAFTAPDGATLYLKRAGDDHAGEWCFPGGSIEPGETPEQAAIRECREEIGAMPYGERRVLADLVTDGVRYATFVQPVAQRFTPKLNGEHSAFAWSEKPPEPLHPGVRAALARGLAQDAWAEADHTRADNGQFGSGSGGASAAPAVAPTAAAAAATAAPGAQSFLTPALYAEAKRTIALYSKKDAPGRKLTASEQENAAGELAGHLAAAEAAKPAYDAKLAQIGKQLGAEVKVANVKGGDRLLEKHVTENESDPAMMRDLVRGSLIVRDIKDVPAALEAIQANFELDRTKDRFANPMGTGYRDLLVNVKLPGGIVGEIQVHIPEMIAAKGDIGHALYDIERKLPGGHPLKSELVDLQSRVYGSAHEAHLERTSKRLTPVRTNSANSSADKSSPSIPALDSFGYGRDAPSLKLNATHRPVCSSTTAMPSTSKNRDPSGTSESFIAAPNAAILPLAQDDEHWITTHPDHGGAGSKLLISGGGVVIGGAGGSLNGKVLHPSSKSASRPQNHEVAGKFKNIQKSLQNRNRSSAASISQMNKIAANPNPRLLMSSPTMNDGAPVVTDLAGAGIAQHTGKRDYIVTGKREIPVRYAVVESGDLSASNRADGTKNDGYAKDPSKLVAINNGRTAGVIEAYSRGTADKYKAALAKAEKVHGIPAKTIKGMKTPVLVRIMDAADVDEHIGDESNSTQTLSLSAVEQAQNDANRFDPSAIEYSDDGQPTDASVHGFINAMPQSEQQSLSPNGRPTKQAIDRMMAATFHAAYGDTELVGLMAQATDPESRNLISGMSRAAGSMAKLKDAGDLDFRELVTGAAKQIINAVRSGVGVKKFLKQGDLLTGSAEDDIARLFAENSRSAKAIGEKLDKAAKFAYAESQKGGVDMFGDLIPTASRTEVLGSLHAQP